MTSAGTPAFAAIAAIAEPMLPEVRQARPRAPCSRATLAATPIGRSLNDPLGLEPSIFIMSLLPAIASGTRVRSASRVPPAPRSKRKAGSTTGKSSRYRHKPAGRRASSSRSSADLMAFTSYCTPRVSLRALSSPIVEQTVQEPRNVRGKSVPQKTQWRLVAYIALHLLLNRHQVREGKKGALLLILTP